MKFKDNVRVYAWIEFFVWFIILSLCIWGFRFYKYEKFKKLPSYQIFMPDVDGMIVGSPVKYMGVQVGYVKNIKILTNQVYVRFVITDEDLKLPKGVQATVEFNGLGGSKSLELYPPDENVVTEKLIVINQPKRLHDSMGLLNDMFDKIGAMSGRLSYFANKMGVTDKPVEKIELNSQYFEKNIKQSNDFVEGLIKNRENFQKRFKGVER